MIPANLKAVLETNLGTTITHSQPCYGGDINQSAQVRTQTERYFVKWHPQAPPRMFIAEARGLAILESAEALRVPQVIAYQDKTSDTPAFLLLEWLESGQRQPTTATQLGAGLAQLHHHHADQHGLDHANYIGSLPQPNTPTPSWVEFYGEQRIRAQMEIARQKNRLSGSLEKILNCLIDRLPELLPNPSAALLHGDLWGGNVMTLADGQPAIIDPAVYYGHREVELAFTELFGGFRTEFYDAYQAHYPLDKEYAQRKALYQLYPLMTHMNLFGGGYTSRVEAVAKHFAG